MNEKKHPPIMPREFLRVHQELRLSRKVKSAQMIEDFWPADLDHGSYPEIDDVLEEFDRAIDLIKNRRKRFLANRPKRKPGGQATWDKHKYNALLYMHDWLRSQGMKGAELDAQLCYWFGISNPKKIQSRLKKAREQVDVDNPRTYHGSLLNDSQEP